MPDFVSTSRHAGVLSLLILSVPVLAGASDGAVAGSAQHGDPSSPGALSIRVKGNRLIDGAGHVVRLRGANVSGLEYVAVQGWSPDNPWGANAQVPGTFLAMKTWRLNAVRLPLNEASWLGLTTYDWPSGGRKSATARKADPGNNYRQTVIRSVDAALRAGMYVILDLHLDSPDAVVPGIAGKVPTTPTQQNSMADADHSVAFWTSVANSFKSDPGVVFDLFNEPHIDNFAGVDNARDASAWMALRDGGTCAQFITGSSVTVNQSFQTAGMQTLVNAVRATGATNVIMVAGISWAQDTSRWVEYAPKDPLHQLAASWHAYPKAGLPSVPGFGPDNYAWAETILAAGYPIVIGETGDHSAPGTTGSPLLSHLLPWSDAHGVSVLGWTWNAWNGWDNDLIKDAAGTPTDGYGQAFRAWAMSAAR